MTNRNEGRSSEELERTLYVANLDDRVTDELLYELMIQAGPVDQVSRPKDRPFAFVVFEDEESVPYSIALFRNVRLFDRQLDIRPRDGTEQARKINQYMSEVREKRRQLGLEGGDRRSSSSNRPPPMPFPHTPEGSRYASYSADSSPVEFGHGSRSMSWPKLHSGDGRYRDSGPFMPPPPPPMGFMPPPPPPPSMLMPPPPPPPPQGFSTPGPSGIRDFSQKRRHDDRRYDTDDRDSGRRHWQGDYEHRRRDDRYDSRDRSRDRDDDWYGSSGRRSRNGNRK